MIITSSKALRLISNAEVVRKIPALAALSAELAAIRKRETPVQRGRRPIKRGCSRGCKGGPKDPKASAVAARAEFAIRSLPSADKERLKKHLGTRNLTFYIEAGGGRKKKLVF